MPVNWKSRSDGMIDLLLRWNSLIVKYFYFLLLLNFEYQNYFTDKTEKVLDSVVRFSGEGRNLNTCKTKFPREMDVECTYIRFIAISPLGSRFWIKCVLRSMYLKKECFKLFISNFA